MLRFVGYDVMEPYNTHSCISERVQLLCHDRMHTSQSLRRCYSQPQAPGALGQCIQVLVALGGWTFSVLLISRLDQLLLVILVLYAKLYSFHFNRSEPLLLVILVSYVKLYRFTSKHTTTCVRFGVVPINLSDRLLSVI